MDRILTLNLHSEDKSQETVNPPKEQGDRPATLADGKKLNQIANKAAHKAAKHQQAFERERSNLFSK